MFSGGKSKKQLLKLTDKLVTILLGSIPTLLTLDIFLIIIFRHQSSLVASIIALITTALFILQLTFKNKFFSAHALTIYYLILVTIYIYSVDGFDFIISLILSNFSLVVFYYANKISVLLAGLIALGLLLEQLYFSQNSSFSTENALKVIVMAIFFRELIILIGRFIYSKAEINHKKIVKKTVNSNSMLTLINNLDSGIIELDKEGKIKLYNAGCLQILDTNKTLTNLEIDQVLNFEDLNGKKIDIKKMILETKRFKINENIIYYYQTGEKIRIKLTISPIKNNFGVNEDSQFLLIMHDITKEKNLELQKDEFISVTSHELRTPIAIAEGTLSNLELMTKKKNIDKDLLKKLITRAHKQIIFLSSMVNDLSSLSRAERDEILELEQIDLREFAHQMYEKYQPQAKQKNLNFDLDLAPRLGKVTTHSLYFEEIIQNFITNSIKYTKTGSIKLIIKKDNLQTTVSVKDTGLGIGKNDQKKIFDKFYRVEDYRTRETKGTGLGLYVSQTLAGKLGGKITVDSRINFGSTFSLIIPNKPPKKKP